MVQYEEQAKSAFARLSSINVGLLEGGAAFYFLRVISAASSCELQISDI